MPVPSVMKAIGHPGPRGVDAPDALVLFETEVPEPGPRDILIKLHAVAANLIDTKLRASAEAPRILGFDGAGVVMACGRKVGLFEVGDTVAFMGQVDRPGTFAQYALVDERLAAIKPASLSFEDAAALPLAALTAYELLFERMGIREDEDGGHLLIIGAAGGVGSMAIQLARQLTRLKVIATASRPETAAWCRELGAHEVISHRGSLAEELRAVGITSVDHVASLAGTGERLSEIAACLRPFGTIGVTDHPASLDVMPLRARSQRLAFEGVFVRSLMQTTDRHLQHESLQRILRLHAEQKLRVLHRGDVPKLTPVALIEAHRLLESGRAIGKLVFTIDGME